MKKIVVLYHMDEKAIQEGVNKSSHNWQMRIGIGLMVICIPFFLLIPVIPFLNLDSKTKVGISTALLVVGEILFWVGGLLVGKELLTKYKSSLNPKNWFKRTKTRTNG